jgi:UDP-2,3-diacylglucosamine pyrophosphatase LpxH
MILIADSHVSTGNAERFFAMLALVARSDHDVVFLGDIFELWIALKGYESESHRRFLDWCRQQKAQRQIGFVEGNHEFFVCEERRDCFTWCSPEAWRNASGHLFVHGDMIDQRDVGYRRFRKLTKNSIVKFFLRHAPGGPRLAEAVRCRMKRPKLPETFVMPEAELAEFADAQFQTKVEAAFAGHFHRAFSWQGPQKEIFQVLPAWCDREQIAIFDASTRSYAVLPWQELASIANS